MRAVLAEDALALEPRISADVVAGTPGRIAWVAVASGDFRNLHDLAWSGHGVPNPQDTTVIDDATGTVLGVYPYPVTTDPGPSAQ